MNRLWMCSDTVMSDSSLPHTLQCLTLYNPWTVACQAPLSMAVSQQEHWSGLPFPSLGDLLDPGMEPKSSIKAGRFFYHQCHLGSPSIKRDMTMSKILNIQSNWIFKMFQEQIIRFVSKSKMESLMEHEIQVLVSHHKLNTDSSLRKNR